MCRLAYEKPVVQKDGTGNEILNWQRQGFLWGQIKAQSSSSAGNLESVAGSKITIRLRHAHGSGINRGWRLIHGGATLTVISLAIASDGDNGVLVQCEASDEFQ